MDTRGRFGARVYLTNDNKILIYQTRKRGTAQNSPYIVFPNPETQQVTFVNIANDKEIADTIRAALNGTLA